MDEIKRKTELYICRKLREVMPGYVFVPFTGGSEEGDAFEILPPFIVISVTQAQRMYQTESTWTVQGVVQIISHMAETRTQAQSQMTHDVYTCLANLPSAIQDATFSFHGIDVEGMNSVSDAEAEAHADVITFTAGVGG